MGPIKPDMRADHAYAYDEGSQYPNGKTLCGREYSPYRRRHLKVTGYSQYVTCKRCIAKRDKEG